MESFKEIQAWKNKEVGAYHPPNEVSVVNN